jgi:hypothetical protein
VPHRRAVRTIPRRRSFRNAISKARPRRDWSLRPAWRHRRNARIPRARAAKSNRRRQPFQGSQINHLQTTVLWSHGVTGNGFGLQLDARSPASIIGLHVDSRFGDWSPRDFAAVWSGIPRAIARARLQTVPKNGREYSACQRSASESLPHRIRASGRFGGVWSGGIQREWRTRPSGSESRDPGSKISLYWAAAGYRRGFGG